MKKKKLNEAFEGMSGIVTLKPIHNLDTSLTKMAKNITEGPAYEYKKQVDKIAKLYDEYWDSVNEFTDLLHDKGMKKEGNELHKMYMKMVSKFHTYFTKFVRKLM